MFAYSSFLPWCVCALCVSACWFGRFAFCFLCLLKWFRDGVCDNVRKTTLWWTCQFFFMMCCCRFRPPHTTRTIFPFVFLFIFMIIIFLFYFRFYSCMCWGVCVRASYGTTWNGPCYADQNNIGTSSSRSMPKKPVMLLCVAVSKRKIHTYNK